VGEGWDEREKFFRNLFGAFTTTSKLFLLVKFGQAVEKSSLMLQLEYRFSGPEGVEENTVVGTPWSKGEELVDMSKLKLSLVPGVWRVQASHQGQTVATMQFIVLSEDTQGDITDISLFYPTTSLCSVSNMSMSTQCLPGVISCQGTDWSSVVEDRKSLFP